MEGFSEEVALKQGSTGWEELDLDMQRRGMGIPDEVNCVSKGRKGESGEYLDGLQHVCKGAMLDK